MEDLISYSFQVARGMEFLSSRKVSFALGIFSLQKDGIQRWNHVYVLVTPSLGELPKEELLSSWRYKYNGVFIQVTIVHKHRIMAEGSGSSSFIQGRSSGCGGVFSSFQYILGRELQMNQRFPCKCQGS